jgi:hypothetical protein
MGIIETKFLVATAKRTYKMPVTYSVTDKGRIEFLKAPFALKDEIKSMKGSRWHGHIDGDKRSIWSVENCTRNRFQIEWLQGGDPFAWFDRPLIEHDYPKFGSPGFGYFDLMTQQVLMANTALTYHYQVWGAEMGTGKFGRLTTPVLTPTGWVNMGDLKTGSRLIDPDGGECKVLSLHPQGTKEVFKVTFTDGSSTDCGAEHLWRVQTPNWKHRGQGWKVLETQEMVKQGLQFANGNNKWFIPMVEPVEFDKRKLVCDPYLMGYWLGNGYKYNVSTPDQETVDRLNQLMSSDLKPSNETVHGEKIDYKITCKETREALGYYNLLGTISDTKFVPEDFLYNTLEVRTKLLQGLLDSDGCAQESSGVEFTSASNNLATSMVFLIQSLGGTCARGLKEEPTYTYKGEKRIGKPSHRINGSFNSSTKPFLLSRKANAYTVPTKYEPTRAIISVESVGFDECICIKVDSDTHCYVTDEFIVTHNTLAAIATMTTSETKNWWWVGPKSSLYGIRQEFDKWGLPEGIVSDMMSYEGMMQKMRTWKKGDPAPIGVIFDESQNLKTPTAQRTQCAQKLADAIRNEHGNNGFVILMTGTPSPKSPADWWAPCEIAAPGFIKEGTVQAFEKRLGFYRLRDDLAGQSFNTRTAWRDDENRCGTCGHYMHEGHHMDDTGLIIEEDTGFDIHNFQPSENEVFALSERLDGLVTIVHKKDCLDLPDKIYKEILCEPSPSLLRVASALTKTAPNVITGLTHLRTLSDGFQYRDVKDGVQECSACTDGTEEYYINPSEPGASIRDIDMLSPEFVKNLEKVTGPCGSCEGTRKVDKYKRITREVPCPKEDAVVDLLKQNEDQKRIVFFAGFTGSLDRITRVCQREGWDTMRVDGRGWKISQLTGVPNEDGSPKTKNIRLSNPMDYWIENPDRRIAFVAHPKSGGVALTLCPQKGRPGAVMCVYYSNDFNPASRSQSEDRIHRVGMDENKGAMIVDLFHLPTDRRVLEVLRKNRKLEKMTMGDFDKDLEVLDDSTVS